MKTTKTLMPDSYFESVVRSMRMQGLHKFAEVVIDQDDHRNHIEARTYRNTALFFHLPNRAMIVQMVYSENDYLLSDTESAGSVHGHWTIHFYVQFMPYRNIISAADSRGIEVMTDAYEQWIEEIPLFQTCPQNVGGLRYHGGSSGDELRHAKYTDLTDIGPADATMLAQSVGNLVYKVADLLRGGQFTELQVTDFPPHYTFPGSEELFWSRFDRAALRRLVRRPWGSEGLKR